MSLIMFALLKKDFKSAIVKQQKQYKFQKIVLEQTMTSEKAFSYVLRLTTYFNESFLTFLSQTSRKSPQNHLRHLTLVFHRNLRKYSFLK